MEQEYVRLTNAVYKLLEFFPESDPLKSRAKDKALSIMSRLSGIPPVAGEQSICEDIDVLLGYLWIAKSQGWLNASNCLIITNEYEKIKKDLCQALPEPALKLPDPVQPPTEKQPQPLSKITPRQEKILDFLSKHEKAQVMDLQTILPNITKRTIRRDLDELLQRGDIIRVGEYNQVFYKKKG